MSASRAGQNKQSPRYRYCVVIIPRNKVFAGIWVDVAPLINYIHKSFTSHKKKCEKFDFVTIHFFLHRGILVSNSLENKMKNYQDDAKWLALLNKDQLFKKRPCENVA